MTYATTVVSLVTARGIGGNYTEDLQAIKEGAVTSDGEFLRGAPLTGGFTAVKEPSEALSVLLRLSGGQVAHGDCCAVVYGGYGGRDPVFRAADAESLMRDRLSPWLLGRDVTQFRSNAEALEREWSAGPNRVHTAIRYGVSQALLHAAALARRITMAEVILEEYNLRGPLSRVPIAAQSGRERYASVDRMILKRVSVMPHGDFTSVAEIGDHGERLREYVRWLRDRVRTWAPRDYQPRFHLDVYGTIGDAFNNDPLRVSAFLAKLEGDAHPHELLVESPVLATSRSVQIQLMSALRADLKRRGVRARLVVDEHCNTLDDVRAFADGEAADMIQVKTPDLGSISQSIDAVILCHQRGLLAFLGGSCNETDWASRVTVQVALATKADLIYNKPGFGVDEGYMIVLNEMSRTLALVAARESATR